MRMKNPCPNPNKLAIIALRTAATTAWKNNQKENQ